MIRSILNNSKLLLTTIIIGFLILVISCSKVIDVDLPDSDPMLVVEGVIKKGQKPIVLLSLSSGYFDPININFWENYLSGAKVEVSVDEVTYNLVETYPSMLEPAQLEYISELFKIPQYILPFIPIPVYTISRRIPESKQLRGVEGKTYDLHVLYNEYETFGSTTMHPVIPIEQSSFFFTEDSQTDSLGKINIIYTDPDTLGNAYRWASRRINKFANWHELAGQVKDPFYIYPLGSVWDDLIVNGQTFDFPLLRYFTDTDTLDLDEIGLWKTGDTVLVKLETIDRNAYETLLSFETSLSAQGNPFSPPSNLISHLDSALGWWIASSESVDTVVCQP
ncbi:MAG: hypothetical protein CL847_04230 [Crocinitomicaceae bacterium]|nr:hypothetical protein [Crocinitomicaceae bacterium]